VHQYRPKDLSAAGRAGDTRDWASALSANAAAFDAFAEALIEAGSHSYETDFVKPGTRLRVIKVESLIDP
jgi:hypothetical protein